MAQENNLRKSDQIVGLESVTNNEILDYLLTKPSKSIGFLQDNESLRALYMDSNQ